jgi:hypothetical protein
VRAFLQYSRSQAEISVEYDECPRVCAAGLEDGSGCLSCPVKEARKDLEATLAEDLGDLAKSYSINSLVSQVIDVSEIEETDSIKTAALSRILKSERNRLERIDAWNHRQQPAK